MWFWFRGSSWFTCRGCPACAVSFRDWAAEETNHPREVIEAALAHVVQNKVEAAYARSDLFARRRLLMDDWADYLNRTARRNARRTADDTLLSAGIRGVRVN